MNVIKFLKPSIFKILVFLFIGVIYLYFAKESVSAVGFGFAFSYESYGFPCQYLITVEIDSMSGHVKTLLFGEYFKKLSNFLFNPLTMLLNLIFIYLLTCLMSLLISKMKN